MKKILLISFVIFTVVATSVRAFGPKTDIKPSEYEIGISFEQANKDVKPSIVLFYADWCTYCMKFMPKFKILSDVYKEKYNFVMINVDNPAYKKTIDEYALGGFPTMYIVDPKLDNRVLISNTLYDNLRKTRVELDRYLRIRALIPSEKIK